MRLGDGKVVGDIVWLLKPGGFICSGSCPAFSVNLREIYTISRVKLTISNTIRHLVIFK